MLTTPFLGKPDESLTSLLLFLGRYKHLCRRWHQYSGPHLIHFRASHCFPSFSMYTLNLYDKSFISLPQVVVRLSAPSVQRQLWSTEGLGELSVHLPFSRARFHQLSLRLGFSPECARILFFGVIPACTRSLNFCWLFA